MNSNVKVSSEIINYYNNAVKALNSGGAKSAMEAYKVLSGVGRTSDEDNYRIETLLKLNQLGRAWFAISGIQAFVNQAQLQSNLIKTSFGGVRTMFAVPAKGVHYLVAVDITVDVNGGVVATQWVTRQPVSVQNIPILLSGKSSLLRESELSGDYFEKYSEINAITSGVRRTPDAMERAVLSRMTEKLRQMRG